MSSNKDFFDIFEENIEIIKEKWFDKKVKKFIKKGNLQKLEEVFPLLNRNNPLKIRVAKKLGTIGSDSSFDLLEKDFSQSRYQAYHKELFFAEIDAMKNINQSELKEVIINALIKLETNAVENDVFISALISNQFIENLSNKGKSSIVDRLSFMDFEAKADYFKSFIEKLLNYDSSDAKEILVNLYKKPIKMQKLKYLTEKFYSYQFDGLEEMLVDKMLLPSDGRLFILSYLQKFNDHDYDDVILGNKDDFYRLYEKFGPFTESMLANNDYVIMDRDEYYLCKALGYEKSQISNALINKHIDSEDCAKIFAEVLHDFGEKFWVEIVGGYGNERDLSNLLKFEKQVGIDNIITIFNKCELNERRIIATNFLESKSILKNLNKASKYYPHSYSHSDSHTDYPEYRDNNTTHTDMWDTSYRNGAVHYDEYNDGSYGHTDSHTDYTDHITSDPDYKKVNRSDLDF